MISIDIVNWDDTRPQAAGILARVQNAGLGTTIGYAFTWSRGDTADNMAGGLDISVITGEAPTGLTLTGSDQIHLTTGNSYRFTFIGHGTNFEGRVYQLPNTTTPINVVTGTDATYASGVGGLVISDNSGTNTCDVTFDNFAASELTPPSITTPPQNQTACVGASVTLNVVATGSSPLAYQWYLNETNLLTGATNDTLMLANLQATNAGNYAVVVTNIMGSVTSTRPLSWS
jgi:hypothetical protein